MQHDPMADGHIIANAQGQSDVGVKHTVVLNIRIETDFYGVIVAASDSAKPNTGVFLENHVANNACAWRYPVLTILGQSRRSFSKPEASHPRTAYS
jgi:hypothetical protein